MVGKGDMWHTPASAEEIEKGNYPSMDAPFKSYQCGERGSQIEIIETVIKNITDTIEQGWNVFTENTAAVANTESSLQADEERFKRQTELGEWDKTVEGNYACVKVVLGRTAYRSCVPKYSQIRLNCSSLIGKNVVCYCQEDDCNGTSKLAMNTFPIVLIVLYVLDKM